MHLPVRGRTPSAGPLLWYVTGRGLAWFETDAGAGLWITLFLFLITGFVLLRRRGLTVSFLGPVLLLAGVYGGAPLTLPAGIDRVPREQSVTGTLLRSPEPALENQRILLIRGRETAAPSSDRQLVFRLKIQPSTPEVMAGLDRLRAGDEIMVWCKAGVPMPYGNPGSADPALYLAAAGIDRTGRVKSARLVEIISPGGVSPSRSVDHARSYLRRGLTQVAAGDPTVAAVLCAMLLGERGGLDRSTLGTLRRAGLVHLIAVSGLHVGLILVVILWFLQKMPLPRWVSMVALPVILAGLVLLTGGRASVLRAASTALLAATGRSIGREGNMLNTLCMAALWMLLLDPPIMIDAGFQLSFGATFSIVLAWRRIRAALPLPAFPAVPLAISTRRTRFGYPPRRTPCFDTVGLGVPWRSRDSVPDVPGERTRSDCGENSCCCCSLRAGTFASGTDSGSFKKCFITSGHAGCWPGSGRSGPSGRFHRSRGRRRYSFQNVRSGRANRLPDACGRGDPSS